MKNYNQIISGITNTAWAIMPNKMDEIMCLLQSKAAGISADYQAVKGRSRSQRNKVAILPMYGVMSQKMNLMTEYSGGTSTEIFGAWLDEAIADPSVGKVVMEIDSPGGSVYGISELSNKIYNARGKKPIIASVNSLAASAAYWVASAADEIHVTPGGEVGSVGVIAVHVDQSKANEKDGFDVSYVTAGKYKAEGNFDEPLGKEARDHIQKRVNDYYSMFVNDLSRNRGVSASHVLSQFGQGRVVGPGDAVKAGMADKISTLEYVLRLPVR